MNKGLRRRLLTVAAAASLLVLVTTTAVGLAADTKGEAEPIRIGTIMTQSGGLAAIGLQQVRGMELAIKAANGSGGINGRKISWKVYDPAADPAKCVELTRKLIEQDKVDIIVGGGAASGCALAMQGIITPKKMFFVSPEADPRISDPPSNNPTTIQTTLRSTTVVQKLLEAAKAKGVRDIAVIGSTDAYGQSGVEAAKSLAAKVGVNIVKTASMSTSASDVTPQLRDLAGSKPGAYIIWTSLPVGVTAIKNAHDLGLNKTAMIMMSHSFANVTFMKQAGEGGKGVYVPVVNATVVKQVLKVLPKADAARLRAFANLYTKAYNQDIAIFSAQCYDAMTVAIRALRLTKGNTDGPTLVKALEKMGTYNGIIGQRKFSPTEHYGMSTQNLRMSTWSGAGWILQKGCEGRFAIAKRPSQIESATRRQGHE